MEYIYINVHVSKKNRIIKNQLWYYISYNKFQIRYGFFIQSQYFGNTISFFMRDYYNWINNSWFSGRLKVGHHNE